MQRLLELSALCDAVLEFSKMDADTWKAVWRHNYKKAKKILRSGNLAKYGDTYSELPDGNKHLANKSGLLWRGTHKGEVEILSSGRFRSDWKRPGGNGKKSTYVAGNPSMVEHYAGTAAGHAGDRAKLNNSRSGGGLFRSPEQHKEIIDNLHNARIYGISKSAMKRSDNQTRSAIGDTARTAPIRGGVSSREVRVLLKPKITKGKHRIDWHPTPLGDVTQKNFSTQAPLTPAKKEKDKP